MFKKNLLWIFLRHLFGNIRLLLIFTASDHIDFDVTHVGSIVFFLRFLTEFKILLVFDVLEESLFLND